MEWCFVFTAGPETLPEICLHGPEYHPFWSLEAQVQGHLGDLWLQTNQYTTSIDRNIIMLIEAPWHLALVLQCDWLQPWHYVASQGDSTYISVICKRVTLRHLQLNCVYAVRLFNIIINAYTSIEDARLLHCILTFMSLAAAASRYHDFVLLDFWIHCAITNWSHSEVSLLHPF